MTNNNAQDLSSMFQNPTPGDNQMSAAATGLIIQNLNISPQTVQGAQGPLADLDSASQTVVAIVRDASSSMNARWIDQKDPRKTVYHIPDVVCEAFNLTLDTWRKSKGGDEIIVSQWQFNSDVTLLHSFKPVAAVDNLTTATYQPYGSTALYDSVMDALTSLVAYVTQLRNAGNTVRAILVVMSDGEDNTSRRFKANDVNLIISELYRQEIYHLAFWAFGDEGEPEAQRMGFRPEDVLVTGADAHAVRDATGMISQSTINISKGVVGVSQGFFGN